MKRQLDEVDRTILRAMTADGRQTIRALAREVGLSEPSVRDRMQRLENDGVISGYHAGLDPASVDAGTAAFITIRFEYRDGARALINERLRLESRVLEVHQVAGDDCYLLKVRAADTDELADLVDRIRAIPPVTATGTTIVLRTILERPLSVADPEPEGEL